MRDAYIDAYVRKFSESGDLISSIEAFMEYKLIGNEYLILASYFDNEKKFKEIKEKVSEIRESQKSKLWEFGRKLASKEYTEEMTENLGDI